MSDFDQWVTKCPKCGAEDRLIVTEVRLCCNGEIHNPDSRLQPDGFEVDPECVFTAEDDLSTEDEKVVCLGCLTRFDLCDLTVPERKED